MEEDQAIVLLKRGDLRGLEELVQRYQVPAVQTAYLIVGDRSKAEDIAQSAFLKAATKIHQFQDGRPFRPWFLRIVTNDAIKAASRAKRHRSLDAALEMDMPPGWLLDPGPDPEELVDTARTGARGAWLQQLTPIQRVYRHAVLPWHEGPGSLKAGAPARYDQVVHSCGEGGLRSLLRRADLQETSLPPESNSDRGPGKPMTDKPRMPFCRLLPPRRSARRVDLWPRVRQGEGNRHPTTPTSGPSPPPCGVPRDCPGLLVIVLILVGPERALAALRGLFGYIPGIGLVDETGGSVLAEPVTLERRRIDHDRGWGCRSGQTVILFGRRHTGRSLYAQRR
jgi:RNA polymerase sigma factor (sigma-70 family)